MADYTIFNLVVESLDRMDQLKVEKASGGSTASTLATICVAELGDRGNDSGTMFVLSADGAAPEGQWSIISAYDDDSVFTVGEDLTPAVAEGDIIAWTGGSRNRLYELLRKINSIWSQIGTLDNVDTTSITTAANQKEYEVPQEIKRGILSVWLQMETDDSDANAWEKAHGWYLEKSIPGDDGKLVFYSQPPAGRSLKIVYRDYHPDVWDPTDVISEDLDRELLIAAVISTIRESDYESSTGTARAKAQKANTAIKRLANALVKHAVSRENATSTTRYTREVAKR